jgi:hypothetical protein
VIQPQNRQIHRKLRPWRRRFWLTWTAVPQQEEGWPRHQEEAAKPPLNGADGVVWSRNSWTTPPRLHELMRLRDFFLIVQPPLLLLRRGVCAQTSSFVISHLFGHASALSRGTAEKPPVAVLVRALQPVKEQVKSPPAAHPSLEACSAPEFVAIAPAQQQKAAVDVRRSPGCAAATPSTPAARSNRAPDDPAAGSR